MDEALRKYIVSLNCKIINPILAKIGSKEIVGWHCKSTSTLRKPFHLKEVDKFIQKNNLNYNLLTGAENRTEFSIYIN